MGQLERIQKKIQQARARRRFLKKYGEWNGILCNAAGCSYQDCRRRAIGSLHATKRGQNETIHSCCNYYPLNEK